MRKFEVFKKRMLVHFFLAFLKKSITENFRSLRDLLINLDHEEKELFEMVFFNFFKMGIAYKYFKEIYSDEKSRREIDEDFSSFIKSLPLWQELEKLGLTEKVEKSLENFASKKNR